MPQKLNSENHCAICPTCGSNGIYLPPTRTDKKKKKIEVDYICINGHTFTLEHDIK